MFEGIYNANADIWGIGCVAYQMITGSIPWEDKGLLNLKSLFNHIKEHKGPPPIEGKHTTRLSKDDKSIYSVLDKLLNCCFDHDLASRPDACSLMHHEFFTGMHQDVDDESIPQYKSILLADVPTIPPLGASELRFKTYSKTLSPRNIIIPNEDNDVMIKSGKTFKDWRGNLAYLELLKREVKSGGRNKEETKKPKRKGQPIYDEIRKRGGRFLRIVEDSSLTSGEVMHHFDQLKESEALAKICQAMTDYRNRSRKTQAGATDSCIA